MSCCTSDVMPWEISRQLPSRTVNFVFTSCSQNTPVHRMCPLIIYYPWLVEFWELIPCLHLTILNSSGLWLVVPFFFSREAFYYLLKTTPIYMYKSYYFLNLCLFVCYFFGSTGLNFYPLHNEVAKPPRVVLSYSSMKQDCFSHYWFRKACFARLVPWWVIGSRWLMWKRDLYRRSF